MAITATTFANMRKTRYVPGTIEMLGYKDNPLLALLSKSDDFTGDPMTIGVWSAGGGGRSANLADALSNIANHQSIKFQLTQVSNYAAHTITALEMARSKGREAAFVEAKVAEMDEVFYLLMRDLNNDLYRGGTGLRGRAETVNASPWTDTATESFVLGNREDVVHFELGMVIRWSSTETGAVDAGTFTVTARDEDTGTVTGTYAANGGSTPSANDYLFAQGDAQNGGATANKVIGLDGWIPATAPTSGDSFKGADRSADPVRYAGSRFNASGANISTAILDAGTLASERRARPDVVMANPVHVAQLIKEHDNKTVYNDIAVGSTGQVFVKSIVVQSGAGPVKVIADPNCPPGTLWMLQLNTWKLFHLNALPHVADEDGLSHLRGATTDDYTMRVRYWVDLGCFEPAYNTRITVDVP